MLRNIAPYAPTIEGLTDEDDMCFSKLAWDYAKENSPMPLPELIYTVGQFHRKQQTQDEDEDEDEGDPPPFEE